MSNSRFTQPTQKGTELFPAIVQKTCRVRFDGVDPGSPAARMLLGEYEGLISQFHNKAVQAYALSPVPVMNKRTDIGGVKMDYTNVQGTETIRVQLPTKVLKRHLEKLEETPVTEPWEYALIELVIPDMDKTGATVAAFVPKKETEYANTDGVVGKYLTFARDTLDEPVISTTTDGTDWYASLKVDLTQLKGATAVDIDLYGYIHLYYDDGDAATTGSNPAARVVLKFTDKLGDKDPEAGGFPVNDGGPVRWTLGSYTWSELEAVHPDLIGIPTGTFFIDRWLNFITAVFTYDTSDGHHGWQSTDGDNTVDPGDAMAQWGGAYTETFTYFSGSILKSSVITGSRYGPITGAGPWTPGPGGPPAVEDEQYYIQMHWEKIYYMPTSSSDPEPQYIDRNATLSTLLFRHGDPMDAVGQFMSDDPDVANVSWRWENESLFPDRWKLNEMDAVIQVSTLDPPGDTSPGNHFGATKLGTVTLDLIHGSASWKGV